MEYTQPFAMFRRLGEVNDRPRTIVRQAPSHRLSGSHDSRRRLYAADDQYLRSHGSEIACLGKYHSWSELNHLAKTILWNGDS